MGAIDAHDLAFINHLMTLRRPARVLEIGTCTGFSAGMIARILDAQGGGALTCVDHDDRVYFDRAKPVGFLIDAIAPDPVTRIDLRTGQTALDLALAPPDAPFDMVFIDASHQHPWPVIDTLCVLPLLAPGALVVHHDLQLYRSATNMHGSGPKMLFDRLLPRERMTPSSLYGDSLPPGVRARAITDNIFAFLRDADPVRQARRLADGFLLPWHLHASHVPGADWQARFAGFLASRYPADIAEAWGIGARRHLAPTGATREGLLGRLRRKPR